MTRPIIVTGAAGFIGFHLTKKLLDRGDLVVGIDNLNSYYDVSLKEARLTILDESKNFTFQKLDLSDGTRMNELFEKSRAEVVVHLAAQAGVRYSIDHPEAYIQSNLVGFANVLEACRYLDVKHLVYASSSSVYGSNRKLPYAVEDRVDHPVSLYAATKKSNELLAHAYAHLYRIPTTGLRFFTVYGPWGRPDMAYYSFTKRMFTGETIQLFNNGHMKRDFTYVDDVVEAMERLIDHPAESDEGWTPEAPDPASSSAPYRIYNVGNHSPVKLLEFVDILEQLVGRKANVELAPMQPGDVLETFADVSKLREDFGFSPATPLSEGLSRFVEWFREYHRDLCR